MLDIIMLGLVLVCFIAAEAFAFLCDSLVRPLPDVPVRRKAG